jgi:hypothetical protein
MVLTTTIAHWQSIRSRRRGCHADCGEVSLAVVVASHCAKGYLVAAGHVFADQTAASGRDKANSQTGESPSDPCRNGAADKSPFQADCE